VRDYYIAIFLGGFREIVAGKLASFHSSFKNLKKKKKRFTQEKCKFLSKYISKFIID